MTYSREWQWDGKGGWLPEREVRPIDWYSRKIVRTREALCVEQPKPQRAIAVSAYEEALHLLGISEEQWRGVELFNEIDPDFGIPLCSV